MSSKHESAQIEEELQELCKLRCEWFDSKNLNPAEMMGYLSAEFVVTLAMRGYSEEFVKKTFEMMFEMFKKHPKRVNKGEDECH